MKNRKQTVDTWWVKTDAERQVELVRTVVLAHALESGEFVQLMFDGESFQPMVACKGRSVEEVTECAARVWDIPSATFWKELNPNQRRWVQWLSISLDDIKRDPTQHIRLTPNQNEFDVKIVVPLAAGMGEKPELN